MADTTSSMVARPSVEADTSKSTLLRVFRPAVLAVATCVALLSPSTPVFAQSSPSSTTPSTRVSDESATTTPTSEQESPGPSQGSQSDSDEPQDENTGSIEYSPDGGITSIGPITADHIQIGTAVVSLLGAILGAVVVLVRFIPSLRDALRSVFRIGG